MFVLESTLNALVPFSIIGFAFTAYIVWKYCYRFGGWAMGKILEKLITQK